MNVYGIAGWKNSGKTGLVTRLVAEFAARGLSVSTVKHAHHAFDIDHEGRDSFRHRAAGAGQVAIISSARMAVMTEFRGAPEPDLAAVLAGLAPTDLVLVEGYKTGAHPKIEIRREDQNQPPLADQTPNIRAIVSDGPVTEGRPFFGVDETRRIADFILTDLGMK